MSTPQRTVIILISTLATFVALSAGQAAQAACYGPGQQLPTQAVSRFINDPAQLLTQFPSGGRQMISLIRDLVASEPGTLPLILDLSAKASSEQVQAIGTGLGQAARVCSRTAPAFASEIQQMTVATNVQPVTQAFAVVTSDLFLGSVGPASGGGAGGGGSGQNGPIGGVAASGAPFDLTTSVPTTPSNSSTLSLSVTPGTPGSGGSGSSSGLGTPATTNGLVAPVITNGLGTSVTTNGLGTSVTANGLGTSVTANGLGTSVTANGLVAPVSANGLGTPSITSGLVAPVTTNGLVARGINSSRSTSPSQP
jgi:hypothetical protein